jgi:hypothetical protein
VPVRRFQSYNINAELAMQAKKKHLWYLGSELMAFAFCSDHVPAKIKFQMQKSLKREAGPDRILKLAPPTNARKIQLAQLVNSTSKSTLEFLNLDIQLLTETHPSTWKKTESYQNMKTKIYSIKVVKQVVKAGTEKAQLFLMQFKFGITVKLFI